jgi:hypothetical protein
MGSTALSNDLADRLLAGIEDSQATTLVAGGGKDLIKLGKGDGLWSIGQADEPMQVGSKWLINVVSICHGYICWSKYEGSRKNERLGEVMVPMYEPKPGKPAPIDGFPFAEQRSFEAVCLNGEDAGAEVLFKNGSVGTMKAFKKLEDAVKSQLRTDRAYPCPVIQFKSDKYKHPEYSWIWNPIFEVVDWADMQGNLKSDAGKGPNATAGAEPDPKPAPAAAPAPRRSKPALVADDVVLEPAQAPVRPAQRRRPAPL